MLSVERCYQLSTSRGVFIPRPPVPDGFDQIRDARCLILDDSDFAHSEFDVGCWAFGVGRLLLTCHFSPLTVSLPQSSPHSPKPPPHQSTFPSPHPLSSL